MPKCPVRPTSPIYPAYPDLTKSPAYPVITMTPRTGSWVRIGGIKARTIWQLGDLLAYEVAEGRIMMGDVHAVLKPSVRAALAVIQKYYADELAEHLACDDLPDGWATTFTVPSQEIVRRCEGALQ